jgi:hypothetical protein
VITNALAGAPQEARLVELMDNRDGSLSIFTTMLPHAAPLGPPAGAAGLSPAALASISREMAKRRRPAGVRPPGAGGRMRNVELVVRDPRRGAPRQRSSTATGASPE